MDHRLKWKAIKLPEDKIGEILDAFFDTTAKAQSMKEIIGKLDFITIKNFCSAKDNVTRMKRQATDREKTFAKEKFGERLFSKICKELLKLKSKKTT